MQFKDVVKSTDIKNSNLPNFEFMLLKDSIYLKASKTLVISDIHLGYESALTKEGIYLPETNAPLTAKKLKDIGKTLLKHNLKVEKLIINGDIKHSFSELNSFTKKELDSFLEQIQTYIKPTEIIIIIGNHDTFLNLYFSRKEIPFIEDVEIDNVVIAHGHKSIDLEKGKTYIIGHEHPAVGLRKGTTYEQYKCFLFGKEKDSNVILPPSFSNVSVGSNIFKGVFLSPLMRNFAEEGFIMDWMVIISEENEFFIFDKLKDIYKL